MTQNYLDTLNKQQREAAEHKEGPLLVLAGAGSGKTYTMTIRMKHLVSHHKIRPENILGITFTNKAAGELKERAIHLVGHEGKLITISTFHSLCVKILRKDIHHLKESKKMSGSERGYDSSFSILDSKDSTQLIKESMKELEIDTKEYSPLMFQGYISSFKNELMSPETVERFMSLANNPFWSSFDFPPYLDKDKSLSMVRRIPMMFWGLVLNIYKRYQQKLVQNNSTDFDDLIFLTVRLFAESPNVLGYYQEKYKYMMIDEYQDTNHAQYIFAKLIAAKYRNLAVVGDDFQCLHPDTEIKTSNGSKKIKELVSADELLVFNGTTVEPQSSFQIKKRSFEGELVHIQTTSGYSLRGTKEHCVFIKNYNPNIQMQKSMVMFGGENGSHLLIQEDKTVLYSSFDEMIEENQSHSYSKEIQIGIDHFLFTPMGEVLIGDVIPVYVSGEIVYEQVEKVEQEWYEGQVYDIDVEDYHNYIANDILVHNSIYGFRNADIRNILEFEKDYKNAKVVTLERNYRSTQQILDRANRVISHNKNQRKKTLWTDKTDGEAVLYHVLDNGYGEAEYVAQQILMLRSKYQLKDFAILYRINAASRVFEDAMMRHGIAYDLVGAINFYERKEIKDIIAYLRLINNPEDDMSLKRVINSPKRGIGQGTLDKAIQYADEHNISLWSALEQSDQYLTKSTLKKIQDFVELMKGLVAESENIGVGMLIDAILEDTGYRADLKKQNNPEAEDRLQNLEEFLNVAWDYQQIEEEEVSITGLLERITLNQATSETDPENQEESDFIRMMTIHASKGLEYKVVFVVGTEENLLPYYKSINEDNVEEERRLCYVALTRAKEILYVLRARERQVFNDIQYNEPSRFIKEMGFEEKESASNFVLPW